MFGLSTIYWMALVSRLLGCFNGLLGPIRVSAKLVFKVQIVYDSLMPYFLIGSLMWNSIQAYASEVCQKEYQALGLSLVRTF